MKKTIIGTMGVLSYILFLWQLGALICRLLGVA